MANRLRELRLGSGLTQDALGNAVGVSRQTIISIETGRYIPSLGLAFKIADHFRTTVEEVFRVDERADLDAG